MDIKTYSFYIGNGGIKMNKKYIKTVEISDTEYIGLKSYAFGKEPFCYVDVVKGDSVISKSLNKIYETRKGKYIEKGRKRYYIEKRSE